MGRLLRVAPSGDRIFNRSLNRGLLLSFLSVVAAEKSFARKIRATRRDQVPEAISRTIRLPILSVPSESEGLIDSLRTAEANTGCDVAADSYPAGLRVL
jgi:hypothetical protein